MKLRTLGCLSLVFASAAVQAAPAWDQQDVARLAAMDAAARRVELKAMAPEDRRGLWFAVKSQLNASKGMTRPSKGGASAIYNPFAGNKVAASASNPATKVNGNITYDNGVSTTTFGGGAIIGNRFDTAEGNPVLASGTVTQVQAVVQQGPAFTTSSAGFVLLGPQTVGGGAFAIFSSFTAATGATDTVTFSGLNVQYTGNSFFVLFGDFANSYVPAFGSGTNLSQGHHGVVGYTGGMGPNITGTFDFGGTLNGLVRASGNILPVELTVDLSITKTDGVTSVAPGDAVTYSITASNAGPGEATGATVSDTFPAALTGCTWTCASSAGSACTAGGAGNINDSVNLLVGGTVTYTANCTVGAATPLGGSISNDAAVDAPGGVTDSDLNNNTANDTDAVASPATITGTKTVAPVGEAFVRGGAVVYTITLNNAGPGAQFDNPGDEFVDVLPAGLTYVSSSATSGTTAFAGGSVTWNGSIPAAGSVTITINAAINSNATGQIVNQASMAFDADGNGSNESTAPTDDPVAGGLADATAFLIAAVFAVPEIIPVNATWALLLLAAAMGVIAWRRRSAATRD